MDGHDECVAEQQLCNYKEAVHLCSRVDTLLSLGSRAAAQGRETPSPSK